ncbi:hypothetical protein K503DRAFT_407022 [Rhizopogon vinicolor AM-OR11-026]|uniref:Ribonuclease H1 N-terminal domain-containing protein n=1 Tax=Rhizopogon vinicolor AM-OR11-026 TaxID=1314800 RepID=A0A1B7NB31_9AGAM|nr:hypothetical protein K503DRAFT_407022 [Rhizopogon vinicolor AM-OR11-026]
MFHYFSKLAANLIGPLELVTHPFDVHFHYYHKFIAVVASFTISKTILLIAKPRLFATSSQYWNAAQNNGMPKVKIAYYAVRKGRIPGIYPSWSVDRMIRPSSTQLPS